MTTAKKQAAPAPQNPLELAAVVLAQNPELREGLVEIYKLAIADVRRVYRTGDVRDRAQYTRQLVPMMLRGMQQAEGNAQSKAMLDAFNRMMLAMGGDPVE